MSHTATGPHIHVLQPAKKVRKAPAKKVKRAPTPEDKLSAKITKAFNDVQIRQAELAEREADVALREEACKPIDVLLDSSRIFVEETLIPMLSIMPAHQSEVELDIEEVKTPVEGLVISGLKIRFSYKIEEGLDIVLARQPKPAQV